MARPRTSRTRAPRGSAPAKRPSARPTTPDLKSEDVAIVLLGAFNPSIFQPAWMAAQGLFDETEAASAEVGIIHSDVVSFRVGSINIEVLRERFQAQTNDATAFEALRDLVVGTFGRLAHTPVGAMGINRSTHHEMPTIAAWNAIGHRLLPKAPWESILVDPGTRNLTVQGKRPDSYSGYIQAIFEPSNLVKRGVFQMINDHYQFNEGDPAKNIPASQAMVTVAEVWDQSLHRAQTIAEHILSLT